MENNTDKNWLSKVESCTPKQRKIPEKGGKCIDWPKESPKLVQISARKEFSPSTMPTTSTNWEKAPPLLLLRDALWTVTEVPSGAWPTKSAPSDLNTFITVVTLRPRYFFNSPAFTMGRGLDVSAIAHQPNKRKGRKKKANPTRLMQLRTQSALSSDLRCEFSQICFALSSVHAF